MNNIQLNHTELVTMKNIFNTVLNSRVSLKTFKKIKKYNDALEKGVVEFEEMRAALQKKYAKLDENGKIVTQKTEQGQEIVFDDEEAKNQYVISVNELINEPENVEFGVELSMDELSEVEDLKLTGNEFYLLETFFTVVNSEFNSFKEYVQQKVLVANS